MARRPRQLLALCVGSNYPRTSAALQGCVNDATDWSTFLKARGFDPARLLEPTADQYLAALREHVKMLRSGDVLVHTVSGHGTQVVDQSSGPDAGDEADGIDEALVFTTGTGRLTAVTDDQLAAVYRDVPRGARVLSFADTCFSGGLQRDTVTSRRIEQLTPPTPTRSPRYLPPDQLDGLPLDLRNRSRAAADRAAPQVVTPRPSRVALFSGCAPDELSYDAHIGGRWRGAMTATVLGAFSGPAGAEPMPLRRLHQLVRQHLPNDRWPQSPRLDATYWQRTRWTL